jgi:integrase/recombinase XerC
MSAYFDSIHPNLDVSHPDVCRYVNDYLHYVAVIKGHSLQTAFNYYIDLKEFFRYMAVARHLCDAAHADAFDQTGLDLDFIRSITSGDIYEFLYMLQQQKSCKATTRNRKLSALRGFFKYMTAGVGLLEKSPAADVDSAKNAKVLPKYLTEEQAVELLENIQSDFYERDFCIVTLFLNCGMRLQELVKIDLQDIKDETILLHGKGNKERVAYLTPACIDAMKHYLRERAKMQNIPESDRNALFLSRRTGRRLTPRRVQQIVERCLQTAGLSGKGFSTHKLRHTAATLMYQTGSVDILELKELLGHANVATTQIYTHLDTSQLRGAVNASPLSRVKYIPPSVQNDAEEPAQEAQDEQKEPETQPETPSPADS